MIALVLGATGATGKDLLNLLLEDKQYERVEIFVRRKINIEHPKLIIHIINFEAPDQWKDLVKGDVLYSCLGTTLKVAGSKEAQWKIDYDYQYNFAKYAKENGVRNYVLISAAFASSKSSMFYSKMKGQLEEAVKKLNFAKIIIFNPPVLIRDNSDRPMEKTSVKMIRFLNNIGLFRSHAPMHTIDLAKAMIFCNQNLKDGVYNISASSIFNYAKEY